MGDVGKGCYEPPSGASLFAPLAATYDEDMKTILRNRNIQAILWLLAGIGSAIVAFAIFATVQSVGKQSSYDHYEIAKTILMIVAICFTGASFGFSAQAILDDQPLLPIVGIFLWPAILLLSVVIAGR
jgi:hypothetical protein